MNRFIRMYTPYLTTTITLGAMIYHLHVSSSSSEKNLLPEVSSTSTLAITSATTTTKITRNSNSNDDTNFLSSIFSKTSLFSSSSSSSSSPSKLSVPAGYSYQANNPSEDRWLVSLDETKGWLVGCVFDGHGGWQVSEYLYQRILNLLVNRILSIYPSLDDISIEEKLLSIFQELEESYIQFVKSSYKLGYGEVAKVGSCVLIALKYGNRLTIANCGDCRAVIGTSSSVTSSLLSSDKYYATRITMDHNCREPIEEFQLGKLHPNESDVVVCKNSHACYVKGRLQLTRALGDIYLKHREFNSPPNAHSRGRYIPEPFTPPYVLNRPDVYNIKLDKNDRFIVLATDGVWDFLSDEQVVDIVREYSNASEASSAIVEHVLEVAAMESGMTIEELKLLPPGSKRRSKHDDTTAVVIYF